MTFGLLLSLLIVLFLCILNILFVTLTDGYYVGLRIVNFSVYCHSITFISSFAFCPCGLQCFQNGVSFLTIVVSILRSGSVSGLFVLIFILHFLRVIPYVVVYLITIRTTFHYTYIYSDVSCYYYFSYLSVVVFIYSFCDQPWMQGLINKFAFKFIFLTVPLYGLIFMSVVNSHLFSLF